MEEDKIAIINVATEVKILNIAYATGSTAEDLCIKVRTILVGYSLFYHFHYFQRF